MKKILLFLAFLSFGCVFADDPVYFIVNGSSDCFYTYAYGVNSADVLQHFSGSSPSYVDGDYYAYVELPDGSWWDACIAPPGEMEFFDIDYPYMPFSDDPAYASSVPSGPPSGGGSSGGGGGYSGGSGGSFDASSSLGGMGDLASGLALGVGSLVLAGVGIVSGLLVYRKFVVSAKRV